MFKWSPEYVTYLESFKKFGVRPFVEAAPLRKELGDSISLAIRQDLEFGIAALSPRSYIPYLYSWGKFVGYQTGSQALRTLKLGFWTWLSSRIFSLATLRSSILQDAFARLWIENMAAIPSFTYFDEKAKIFRVKTEECDEASGLPDVRQVLCFYESGLLAGETEAILRRPVNAVEAKCIGHGDGHCEFLAELYGAFPHKIDVPTEYTLNRVRDTLLERMLKPKTSRPRLGDMISLAQFQSIYLGMWLSAPGAHTMLYWIGRQTGRDVGKRLHGTQAAQFKSFIEFLKENKIGIASWKREDRNKIVLTVKECGFCVGSKNFHKSICSYLAGLTAGFLEKVYGRSITVIERMCTAAGHEHCEFVASAA
jgi:predicted hydrocarbon binding protein